MCPAACKRFQYVCSASSARNDQERAEHRVVDRDGDSLGPFRQRDPGENGPEQVRVTIELEREVDFAAREAIETREEVFRVSHRR